LNANHKPDEWTGQWLCNEGHTFLALNRIDEAETSFSQAIKFDQTLTQGDLMQGQTLLAFKKQNTSLLPSAFQEAETRASTLGQLRLFEMRTQVLMAWGEWEMAKQSCEAALKVKHDHVGFQHKRDMIQKQLTQTHNINSQRASPKQPSQHSQSEESQEKKQTEQERGNDDGIFEAKTRQALVISCGDYQENTTMNWAKLSTPKRDRTAMSEFLEACGFEVRVVHDKSL